MAVAVGRVGAQYLRACVVVLIVRGASAASGTREARVARARAARNKRAAGDAVPEAVGDVRARDRLTRGTAVVCRAVRARQSGVADSAIAYAASHLVSSHGRRMAVAVSSRGTDFRQARASNVVCGAAGAREAVVLCVARTRAAVDHISASGTVAVAVGRVGAQHLRAARISSVTRVSSVARRAGVASGT